MSCRCHHCDGGRSCPDYEPETEGSGASSCSAGVWDAMDQFDRAWFCQSVDGTLREDQRSGVEGAIADHERAGNWDVSSTMRKFKFKPNAEKL